MYKLRYNEILVVPEDYKVPDQNINTILKWTVVEWNITQNDFLRLLNVLNYSYLTTGVGAFLALDCQDGTGSREV